VVWIGLKVDALDALRLRERLEFRCMPLEIVDGDCGTQISADLVFLQNQPSGPLTRARRENAPVSLSSSLMIGSGVAPRRNVLPRLSLRFTEQTSRMLRLWALGCSSSKLFDLWKRLRGIPRIDRAADALSACSSYCSADRPRCCLKSYLGTATHAH
jgi:hypothetical protein